MTEIENRVLQRIIELCKKNKLSGETYFYTTIASILFKEFGVKMTTEQIRSISRKYRKDNHLDSEFNPINDESNSYPVTVSINQDGSTTSEKTFSVAHNTQMTPELLLEKHGFDKNVFELVSAKNSMWTAQKKGGSIIDMYSSKITVRPAKEFLWTQDNIDKIFETIKIKKRSTLNFKKTTNCEDEVLIIPISDLHLGLLAEEKTTGNDYNLEIAEELYYYVLNDIIKETHDKEFQKIMFVIGNDFINADNIQNTTTKGTPQDCSNQWHTIIDKAIELCINGINMLKEAYPYSNIDVVYVVSNHDYHSMYGVMNTLEAYYGLDEQVTFYKDPSERKYFQIGEVLIGVAHDIKNPDRALEIMSVEARDKWSNCKSMIWLLGHLHTQMAYSKKGYVEVLRLPTVSGWSRWSNHQGYTQTERRNQSFIINPITGIRHTINTVIKL